MERGSGQAAQRNIPDDFFHGISTSSYHRGCRKSSCLSIADVPDFSKVRGPYLDRTPAAYTDG